MPGDEEETQQTLKPNTPPKGGTLYFLSVLWSERLLSFEIRHTYAPEPKLVPWYESSSILMIIIVVLAVTIMLLAVLTKFGIIGGGRRRRP